MSRNNFFVVCCIFDLGGVTKHLTTGPEQNSKFCFPSALNVLHVPQGEGKENIEGLKETNLTVSLGGSH